MIDPATLWGACRLEGRDGEAFGVEAIAEALRVDLFPAEASRVTHGDYQAHVAAGQALLLQRQSGTIVRMWRIGATAAGRAEAGVVVAFDPDLLQARRDVIADHLPGPLRAAVEQHGRALLDRIPAFRRRAFALHVAGDADAGLALFHLHLLSAGTEHRPQQARGLAIWKGHDVTLIDERPWAHGTLLRLVA